MDALIEQWLAARAAGDDRGAIDRGLRLVEAGRCPVALWLTLPGSWRRSRSLEDLDEFVDSLAFRARTPGGERALLLVAAGRLHAAALATTDALPPELWLLASALGALARGAPDEAARRLALCAPPGREPDLLERVVQAESALLAQLPTMDAPVPWPLAPPPPGPPSPELSARIAHAVLERAAGLRRRGRLLPALGLVEQALPLATEDGGRLSLLHLAAELHTQLAEPALARARLEQALALPAPPPLRARLRLALAAVALEEDRPAEAEALARKVLAADDHMEVPYAELTLGIALAAQERLDEATDALRRVSDAAERGEARREVAASGLHWLGLLAALRGDPAASEVWLRRALAVHPSPPGHPDLASTLTALGTALAAQGQHDEATLRYREASISLERGLGPLHPRSQVAASCLADLSAWGDALALERALSGGALDDPALLHRLRTFPGYILLQSQSTRRLLTMAHGGLACGVVVFTAPDVAEAFLARVAEALRKDLRYVSVSGGGLAAQLRHHGADGAVVHGNGAARAVPLARWE